MWDLSMQQGLYNALDDKRKKSMGMFDEDLEDLDASYYLFLTSKWCLLNIIWEEITLGLWRIIESLYMMKPLTNQIYLKKQLYSLRVKQDIKIVDYFKDFIALISQLTSIYGSINLEDKAVTVLCLFI